MDGRPSRGQPASVVHPSGLLCTHLVYRLPVWPILFLSFLGKPLKTSSLWSLWLPVVAGVVSTLVATVSSSAEETGTLKMRFVYDGDPPAPEKIVPNKDVQFCGQFDLVDEWLLVDPDNKGIKNAIVYVHPERGGSKLPKSEPKNEIKLLAAKNCRFEPRVIIAQTGDTLRITHPDSIGHNANLNFFRNSVQSMMIPVGHDRNYELKEAEPTAIPVDCNIHPWMRAYVVVLEHPFADVSGDDGSITIEGLPAGEELTFRVYHETGRIDEVSIDGKEESWRRSRFDLDIKPGMNDLGDVIVPPAAFE